MPKEFGALLAAAPLAAGSLADECLESQRGRSAREAAPIKARPFPGLYVNLFVPARLHWPEKGLFVRQETRFPDPSPPRVSMRAAGIAGPGEA